MAFTEVDHGDWVRSRAEAAPEGDLWPVDEAALEDAARRRRRGRPVRAAGWACILAGTGYAVWLGMAAAPRDAMVAWGTMGFVAPAGKAPASASPLRDDEPAAVAAAAPPDAGLHAGRSPLPIAAAVVVPTAQADAGVPDPAPLAGRVLAAREPPRPKPAAPPKPATTAPKPAAPITHDPDDPYEDMVSPQPPASAAHEPADL